MERGSTTRQTTRWGRRPARAALGAAVVLGMFAAPARAVFAPKCETSAVFEVPGEPAVVDEDQTASACTSSANGDIVFLVSTGGADFGALYASSEATFLDGDTDQATSSARVEFRDTITVDSPGLAGQIGQVHASGSLSGFIDLTGSGQGAVLVSLISPFSNSQVFFEQCVAAGACNGQLYPAFFAEPLDLTFNVRFGEPGVLALQLQTSVDRNSISSAPGTADVNFGSTVSWGGISEVTYQGAPVAFEIAAESGTDYTVPVPEPSGVALAAVGALALALSGRRSSLSRRAACAATPARPAARTPGCADSRAGG